MAETTDPVAALDAKDLPTRAAATRDLAMTGTLEHVDKLLAKAVGDPSQGVRLGAAAAAADILARRRLDGLEEADATRWLAAVVAVDPSRNIGLFQVCGVLDTPGALRRILVGVRDPRQDVRLGASVGLWRHCASGKVNGNKELQAQVENLVKDPKVKVETRVELARLCANLGYLGVRETAHELREGLTKTVAEIADEAIRKLDNPPSVEGIWVDYGIDGGATGTRLKVKRRIGVISKQDAIDDRGKRGPLHGHVRTMWLTAPGEDTAAPALQYGKTTVFAADGDEVCALGDALSVELLRALDPVLPATAAGGRVRAARLLAEGDVAGAIDMLEAVLGMKKIPADAWWYYADALHRAGRDADAAPHLETYLKKAAKKAPFVEEAKRRLGVE